MTHNTTQNQTTDGNLIVLICAPEHDGLTRFTSTLFEDFPSLGEPTEFFKITHPTTYEQLLAELAPESDTKIALIFCGHGDSSGLLGPGADPSSPDYEKVRSYFYEEAFLYLGPQRMLAFCCSAAVGLGDAFRTTTDRLFIGFKKPIGFVMKEGAYTDWWKKILHGASLALLSAGDAQQIKDIITEIYRSAYKYFSSDEGRKAEWAFFMRMYLRGQMDVLEVIET